MFQQIDLVDLRLVVNISEANSLTGGAKRSRISAPSASVRVRNLEDRIGEKLLNRTSHGVNLTPAGQVVLEHARVILSELDALYNGLHNYTNGLQCHLRIAASAPAVMDDLLRVIRRYMDLYPHVSVHLKEQTWGDVVRGLNNGTYDIGVIGEPVRSESIDFIPYLTDRLVLVAPCDHPISERSSIRFSEALDYQIIGLPDHSAIQGFMHDASDLDRRSIKTNIMVKNYEALCRAVEAGLGVGVLSERSARRQALVSDIKIIPLIDDSAKRDLHICLRKEPERASHLKKMVHLLLDTRQESDIPSE